MQANANALSRYFCLAFDLPSEALSCSGLSGPDFALLRSVSQVYRVNRRTIPGPTAIPLSGSANETLVNLPLYWRSQWSPPSLVRQIPPGAPGGPPTTVALLGSTMETAAPVTEVDVHVSPPSLVRKLE